MANREQEPNPAQQQIEPEFRGRQRIGAGLYNFHETGYILTSSLALLMAGFSVVGATGDFFQQDHLRFASHIALTFFNVTISRVATEDLHRFKQAFRPSSFPD